MTRADLALLLAIDGSASVDYDEFDFIARATGRALRGPEVAAALVGEDRVTLAAVLLFSGPGSHALVVGWTRLDSGAALSDFSQSVIDMTRAVRPGTTALGSALLAAEAAFAKLPGRALRRVLDVAGDGRSNDGPRPAPIRDRLIAGGLTINGLCVLHEEPDLVASYTREVVGGPGSFALATPDLAGFEAAMARKLAREATV